MPKEISLPGRSPPAEDLHQLALSPERALLAAMLRCAVTDARNMGHSTLLVQSRERAITWLRNERAVRYWLDLLELPDWTYKALLREAGLVEED